MIEIARLIWDEQNVAHIARHTVTPTEVEEVCAGEVVTVPTYDERLIVIGGTGAGRMLSIILAPKGDDRYYPVTARPASRKERTIYEEYRGGEQAA